MIPMWIYNVALTVFGFGATLAAFGGETWIKGAQPLRKRIQPRGWISLGLALCALILGVAKELTSNYRDGVLAAQRAADADAVKTKLQEANEKITALIALSPPSTGALYVPEGTTSFGTVKLPSGAPLTVLDGQYIKWTIPGKYGGGARLKIGDYEYPLDQSSGELLVVGHPHTPMPIEVLHPPKGTITPPTKPTFGRLFAPAQAPQQKKLSPILTALRLSIRSDH